MRKRISALAVSLAVLLAACGQQTGRSEAEGPRLQVISPQGGMQQEEPYLALLTDDYAQRSLQEFDEAFLPYEVFYYGYGMDHPELEFMESLLYAKMQLLGEENGQLPYLSIGAGRDGWMLIYNIDWNIPDKSAATVSQRDALLRRCQELVQEAFDELEEAELYGDVVSRMQEPLARIAQEQSTDWVTVRITPTACDLMA